MTADRMVVRAWPGERNQLGEGDGQRDLESKGDEGRTMTGTGEEGEYLRTEADGPTWSATSSSSFMSPSLAEPATITGARADVDLKTQQAVVNRAPREPVKTIIRPKGKPGTSTAPMPESLAGTGWHPGGAGAAAPPEPIELTSNRVEADGRANSFVATGGRPGSNPG